MTSTAETGRVQWRWDRFNAKKLTTVEWAAHNCIGKDVNHQAMQKQVLQDEKRAGSIITAAIHKLLHEAAVITGMTYCCKITQHTYPCISVKDIRLSWMQNGDQANLKRLAWMWYFYGTEIYKIGRSSLTHNEWVEQKVLSKLKVSYMHLANLAMEERTCVQQLYSKKFNAFRSNVICRGSVVQHNSQVNKEQPKIKGLFKKHFKRGKSIFFVTLDERKEESWYKVSSRHIGEIQKAKVGDDVI